MKREAKSERGGGEGEGRPLLRNSTETLATQARKELFHQLFLTCSLIGPIVLRIAL